MKYHIYPNRHPNRQIPPVSLLISLAYLNVTGSVDSRVSVTCDHVIPFACSVFAHVAQDLTSMNALTCSVFVNFPRNKGISVKIISPI